MSIPLKDLCELIVDCPHSTAPDEGEGYPLIRTPNIGLGYLDLTNVHRVSKDVYDKRNARAVPQAKDLILAREAPAGNVGIIPEGEHVCLGQRTVLIRPDQSKIDPWFLNYYLNSPDQRHHLLSSANGATVSHVNMHIIRSLPVTCPDRREQQRIAGILKAYDKLIENSRKQIALLEEAAQRLYKSWFIDYRNPGSTQIKKSEDVPTGKTKLGAFAAFRRGKIITAKQTKVGQIPVIAGGLSPAYYHAEANTTAPVITVSGSGANAGYTAIHNQDIWASDCSYIDSTMTDYPYFVYLTVKILGREFRHLQRGSAQPHVYPTHINDLEFLLPSNELLDNFEKTVANYYLLIGTLEASINAAREARDRLLPKLMSPEEG